MNIDTREITLEPADNARLLALCGPFDDNIKQLERRLGIEINRRDNHFKLTGRALCVHAAADILRSLYVDTAPMRGQIQDIEPEQIHLAIKEARVLEQSAESVPEYGKAVNIKTKRGVIKPRTPNQAQYIANILDHDITFGVGPAGTGKTYLAVAAAVDALERQEIRRILLTRPAVEAGEKLGFLPGDLSQKVDPYLRPLYDALFEMLGFEKVEKLIERNVIEVAPLAYMRGRTLDDSFIILDEAQTLPTDFLQPIVDALKAYQKIFGVSVLFTTASQPVLSGLIEGTNPKANFEGIDRIIEIIPNEFALHDKLRRVKLVIDNTGKTYDEIAAEVAIYNKVLCIVNTRKDAKELYDRLPNEGIKLHLSRMMCPAHISETIRKVKALLKDKSHPIVRVIATQLVEAGVDIDFPVVFRQESGLDSILQAAGRCNREGRNTVGTTFVFSLAAEKRIPFGAMKAANNARLNLPANSDWFDPSTMTEYFYQLYCRKNTFDDKDMKHYLYNPNELCFETASKKFRLIDDDCMNIIVNWGNSMELVEKLKESGCTYPLMKQLAKFTVGVHSSDFDKLVSYGAIEEVLEGIYVLTDRVQYDKNTGLSLDNHWMEELLMI